MHARDWGASNAAPRDWGKAGEREAMTAPGAALMAAADALTKLANMPEVPLPRPAPRRADMAALEKFGADDAWGYAAGHASGAGYRRAVNEEMSMTHSDLQGWAGKMKNTLNFTAGPKVEPLLPGRRAGPGWLAKSRLRGSHSDANPVPNE
jgi:hypothetical protein